jgi:Alpha-glutamyl/putrescinyl thymine pyrophosphorylase clade 2
MVLGAGATGKTTLSRALVGSNAKEHKVELTVTEKGARKDVKAPYVLGSHISIAGNLKNTSDAIGAMDALNQTIDHCWKLRDVVVMDGFRCTNKLVRWVEEHPLKPAALFVYIELSLNNNLARLRSRRAGNGKIETQLPAKTFLNVLRFRERALGVWNYAQDHYKREPVRYVELPEGLEPQDSAKLVESELSSLLESGVRSSDAAQPLTLNRTPEAASSNIGHRSDADRSNVELSYGSDFRKKEYRREVFHRFYQFHLQHRSHPGCVYFVFPFLFKKYAWDAEQRLWFAFINGNTQNPITSKIIFDEFPRFASLDLKGLHAWFNSNWHVLAFDTDRRHHKKEFISAVATYKKLCGDSQANYFATLIGGDDPYKNFRSAWREVRDKFHSFGRLSAFSYLEYIRIMRVGKIDCDQLFLDDMQGSKSHRNGLAIVLGRDDLDWHNSNPGFNGEYSPETLEWLKEEGAVLLAEAKQRAKGKPWAYDVSYFTLESALCTYKSWHRPNRRYPNVYADMFHDRIKKAESHWPGRDFSEFWDARREHLPEHLRLEDNPADVGVKPLKQNHYRLTGQAVMMSEEWPCFKNDYNDRVNAAQRGTTGLQVDRAGERNDGAIAAPQQQARDERGPTWQDCIYDLTPVEKIGDIWFKREDKFSPDGRHNGSKFRQLIWLFSRAQLPGVASGAVKDSPQLPMVAACAKHYGMKCVQFSGARKNMAKAAEDLGAQTMLVNPGYGPLVNKRAKDYAEAHGWLSIETNITVTTSHADIEAFHRVGSEQVRNLPDHMETLIIPAGSRNSAVSILYGLHRYPPKKLKKIILMHINKKLAEHEKEMWERLKACGVHKNGYDITTFDVFADGYTNYEKLMPFSHNGLKMHPRYEGKCMNFIKDNFSAFRPYLNDKTLFWIIGGEPKSCPARSECSAIHSTAPAQGSR